MENNFEKEVRKNLDELRITPPDSAWENIEQRLDKTGKRPQMGWWIFAAGILITALIFYSQYHPPKVENQIVQSEKPRDQHGTTLPPGINETHSETELHLIPKAKENDKPKRQTKAAGSTQISRSDSNIYNDAPRDIHGFPVVIPASDESAEKLLPPEKPVSLKLLKPIETQANVRPNKADLIMKADSIHTLKNETTGKNAWRFAVQASAGISFMTRSFLTAGRPENYYSDPNYNMPSQPPVNPNNPPSSCAALPEW